jgi:hypothetical protein
MAYTHLLHGIAAFLVLAARSDGALRGTEIKGERQGKALCSAEGVIDQFSWDGMYSAPKQCTGEMPYNVTKDCPVAWGTGQHDVYGLVVKNDAKNGSNLYPEFAAVTWASDNVGLGHWLDAVCDSSKSFPDAVCNILPSTVGLDQGDAYAVAAFEVDQLPSTYKLVRPTWMNLFDDDVIRHTYDYVFYKFKNKFSDFSNFKKSCVPDKSVFQYLENNGPSENEKGLTAYQKILTDYGAQMREVGCINEKVSDWYGSCRCENNHECDFAVARFCGDDFLKKGICDPTPYLCPSDGTLPVGYVRAYLEYFLDALPGFRGTGFGEENGKDGEPEYFVSPNIPRTEKSVHMTSDAQCSA